MTDDFKPRFDEAKNRYHLAQEWGEFEHVYPMIRKRHPLCVLEVGCFHAGWIYAVAPACQKGSTLFSIDNDGRESLETSRADVQKRLREEHKRFRWHLGDSRDESTLDAVRAAMLLIDILHLDGDHEYAAAAKDFENFSPMVRPGGLIVFHDIQGEPGVQRLWNETREKYHKRQQWIVAREHPIMGTGVLIV